MRLGAASFVLAATFGCQTATRSDGDGRLVAESQGEQATVLRTRLATAIYAHDPGGDTVFVLSDLPREALLEGNLPRGQVLIIDLLWPPKAGSTPINGDATNTSIRQIVLVGDEVGSYAGAGFAMPSGSPDNGTLRVELWDTTIRLESASAGFRDMLSPATLTGGFTATRDDAAVQRIMMRMRASTLATSAFASR
ncbi:MAG: hypothetical protein ACYTEV_06400 [Planctomycetota bacterium]|jgi:hypothetical protein